MYSSLPFLLWSLFSLHAVSATLNCSADSFAPLLPSNTTVTFAGPITDYGKFTLNTDINITISHLVTKNVLPICVLELNVVSSNKTSFNTGIMLPSDWNGRLFATGNPGFGGGIRWSFQYSNLRYGPSVSVSTDTGHVGAPGNIDWAVGNPESIVDWAYRSLHESVVLAKMISQAYYGTAPAHSYYTACSNGGRQGLKEVQMFPEDFDGVLAGAPPWQLGHLHPYAVQVGLWNLDLTSSTHVLGYKFNLIADMIMDQCDVQDGVKDGIIQEPYACNFSSALIECPTGSTNTTSCFTGSEIYTLSLFYNDWQRSNGSLLFPRFPLSASPSRYGEITKAADAPDHFGLEYLYGFIYNTTTWDWKTQWQGEGTVDFASSLNTGDASALEMDLSAYKDKGGKLIIYHGLSDTTIPTGSSIEYVQGVNSTMGSIEDFFQLYLVPGMGHCGESDVAPYFIAAAGQVVHSDQGNSWSVPGYEDPQHDVLLAMMNWVENGTAPTELIASKWNNNTVEQGLLTQRPICPYPQKAVYAGSGDYHLPASFSCQGGDLLTFPTLNGTIGTIAAVPYNATTTSGGDTGTCLKDCTGNSSAAGGTDKKGAAESLHLRGEEMLKLVGWALFGLVGAAYLL